MDRIGRYEIIEPLGTGAMGRVYRALDTVLEREVALKTIQTGMDASPEIRQRFQREARACARLRHPNIILVYDLGEAEDMAYIAMELLHGADFRRLIQEGRPVPVETKIEAGAQICEALAYAHREGLIHRDIKPSNLFLTDDGCAKVLDFGIARLPASNLTIQGQILGTPKYMAPELIQGRPPDGRSDLFSAAVVLFEFLTGVHPFQSSMTPQRIVQGPPESLLAHNPSLPAALERTIARGMEKDPEQRYATGDEFARELRAIGESLKREAAGGPSVPVVPAAAAMPAEGAAPPERALDPVPPAPEPAPAPVQCPEGQDPEEWRLSEALRLMPEFEAAVERRDLAEARRMLAELEGRLEGDIRFAEALRLCRSRMPLPAAPAAEVSKAPAAVEMPAVQTHAASPGKVDVDATMFGRSVVRPEPPPPPVAPAPAAPRPAPPIQPAAPQAVGPKPAGGRRKAILIGGVVVCGAALAAGAFFYLQPPSIEPAVASAVVQPGGANIYSNPSPGEAVLAAVPAGVQLNVLSLPAHRGQEWIRVQRLHPVVSRPGYIRTNALGNWHAQTAAGALAVEKMMGPGESGTAEEMEAQAAQLSDIGGRFLAEPAGRQARLEAARLRVVIARKEKDAGQPAAEWGAYLKKAQEDLDSLPNDPQLRDAVLDLNQQAAGLLRSAKPR